MLAPPLISALWCLIFVGGDRELLGRLKNKDPETAIRENMVYTDPKLLCAVPYNN
jgi:hypothetical protein